ncbi:Protein PBMUCL2 [Eumeta japonica]|uniref:Protein PBMUCL2 n=1 Tax=Eumeta variegata TaxID=151549 RepID=A0A4C1T7B5_EUMVA|nr:Protein PBMUCL2 [Eumeta japonica]
MKVMRQLSRKTLIFVTVQRCDVALKCRERAHKQQFPFLGVVHVRTAARGRPIIVEWERRKAFGGPLSRSALATSATADGLAPEGASQTKKFCLQVIKKRPRKRFCLQVIKKRPRKPDVADVHEWCSAATVNLRRRARVLIVSAWLISFVLCVPMLILFHEEEVQGIEEQRATFSLVIGEQSATFSPGTEEQSATFSLVIGEQSATFSPGTEEQSATFSLVIGEQSATFSPGIEEQSATFSLVIGEQSATFSPGTEEQSATFSLVIGEQSATFSLVIGEQSATFSLVIGEQSATFSPGIEEQSATFSLVIGEQSATFSPGIEEQSATFSLVIGEQSATFSPGTGEQSATFSLVEENAIFFPGSHLKKITLSSQQTSMLDRHEPFPMARVDDQRVRDPVRDPGADDIGVLRGHRRHHTAEESSSHREKGHCD